MEKDRKKIKIPDKVSMEDKIDASKSIIEDQELLEKIEKEIKILEKGKTEFKKYEYYPGEIKEDLKRIKHVLSVTKNERIDASHIERKITRILSLKEEEKYEKAIDLLHKVILDIEIIADIEDILSTAEEISFRTLEREEKNKWEGKVERIEKKCRKGDYLGALKTAKKLNKMKGEKEQRKEKQFENKLNRARKKLRISRFSDADLQKVKIPVKTGVEAAKRGKINEAIENLTEGLDKLDDLFSFSIKLEKAKSRLKDAELQEVEKDEYRRRLEDLQKLGQGGDFKRASSKISKLLSEISEDGKDKEK